MKFHGKAKQVAERIVEAFKNGDVPKALAPIFLQNVERHCSTYSWTNQLIVALAGHMDAMGYGSKDRKSGWLSVGRQVRKGEKSTAILAPCTIVVNDPKAEGGKRPALIGFRSVAVFGIEQTDVVDAELWAKHEKGLDAHMQFMDALPFREVAEAWGYRIGSYNAKNANAYGWHQRGGVSGNGKAIAVGVENLDVWAHELAHAADHMLGNLKEEPQHWRSEVVAELASTILMLVMGYETDADLGGAYKYVAHYAAKANKSIERVCMDCINRACDAVAFILKTADEVKNGSVTSGELTAA